MNPLASDPDRQSLPFEEWPKADQAAWLTITKKASPLDNPGPGANWRAVTEKSRRTGYGRWLTFIRRHSPTLWLSNPVDRLNRDVLAHYVGLLEHRQLTARTISSYLVNLLVIGHGLAPRTDWTWLKDLIHHFEHLAREHGGPKYCVPPVDVLFELGVDYMDRCAQRPPHLKLDIHVRFRDGLMIALQAARALRMRNLAMIKIGQHLVRAESAYWLTFSADEIKTGEPYKARVPERLTPYFDTYLETHRQLLLQGHQSNALWISNKGQAMREPSLSGRTRVMTERLLGYALPPHAFRHTAATSIAIDYPDLLRTTPAVLHHKAGDTAERYYTMANGSSASRRYQAVISGLRKEHR